MKKIKNLTMLLIAVIMSSTGLVSCIDNDISPVVEDIYRNQALLILSQANLNDAKATYELALATLEEARAAAVASAASDASQAQDDASAAAAQHLSEHEAALEQVIALNAIALEKALMALEEARLKWEADMIALQATIDEANVILASEYFSKYNAAKITAAILESYAVTKQSEIEVAQLLINDSEGVSWEYYLGQQNSILTGLESELAAKLAAAADLAAVIADPTTRESKKSELQDNRAALSDDKDVLETELADLWAQRLPHFLELASLFDLDSDYHDKKDELEDAEDDVEGLTSSIEYNEMEIADLEADIASYDADVLAAETAVTDAEGAVAIADAAKIAADDAKTLTAAALSTADGVVTDANTALTALVADIDALEADLNAAAVALAAQQASVDTGAAAALVTSTAADVVTEQNDLSLAQANYELWRDRFEGGPTTNGGYFWEDTTSPSVDLGDDVLGLQTDDTNVAVVSYVLVDTWMNNGVDDNTAATINGTVLGALPVGGVVYAFPETPLTDAQTVLAYPAVAGVEYYIEVGLDDEDSDNLAEFQAATTAYGNEDVFDVAPIAGASMTTDTGAWADLWNAMLANLDAIAAEAAELQILADLQADYDAEKDLYENELAILDAAQVVVDDAVTAQIPFADADAAAQVVVDDADADVVTADADLVTANDDLDTLLDYTPAEMQEDIEEYQHEIDVMTILLAISEARVTELESEIADIEAELQAAGSGEAWEALIVLNNAMEAIEDEIDAIDMMRFQMWVVLQTLDMDNEDLQTLLDTCWTEIAALEDAIAAQEAVIAMGQVDESTAMAMITKLESQLAAIELSIDGYNALATKYWNLMQAALAA